MPRGKLRPSAFVLPEPADARSQVMRELVEEQLNAINGMKDALEVIGAGIASRPTECLRNWEASPEAVEIVQQVCRLPAEAGQGFMKLKGYLPTSINAESSARYAALLLLFGARALFLGERRGLDSILSSASARGFRYAHHLSVEGALLIDGFAGLYSALYSAELSDPIYGFVSRISDAFHPADRAFVALCVTRSLLVSCGRGARQSAKAASRLTADGT